MLYGIGGISWLNIATLILEKFIHEVPRRHDKVANTMEHLYKTGKIDKDFSGLLKRLYDMHLLSDYGKEIENEPTKEELTLLLEEMKDFFNIAKSIVKS